jgi:hypothetical protein
MAIIRSVVNGQQFTYWRVTQMIQAEAPTARVSCQRGAQRDVLVSALLDGSSRACPSCTTNFLE